MAEMLPKTAWVIRTKSGLPVLLDRSLQLDENGNLINEFSFTDKEIATKYLSAYRALAKKYRSKEKFVLVEKAIDPENVDWAMDEEELRRKAMEEREKCGKN